MCSRSETGNRRKKHSLARRRAHCLALAALTGCMVAIPAASASAVQLPRINPQALTGAAPVRLPADLSPESLNRALNDARPEVQSRFDRVLEAATLAPRLRPAVKSCLTGAFEGATQAVAESLVEDDDFTRVMYGLTSKCLAAQFPGALPSRISQFAEAATNHATEATYDAHVADTGGHAPLPDRSDEGQSNFAGGIGDGGGIGLAAVAVGGLLCAGIVTLFVRRRRS